MKHFLLFLIRAYQKLISPLLGNNCRFYPSCSQYTHQCLDTFPIYKALWYSFKRICKCHPFHDGGLDPVPGSNGDH